MKLQKNPSFRQVATVWHNSDPVCFIMSVFAAVVFYFSLAGVSVALENHAYNVNVSERYTNDYQLLSHVETDRQAPNGRSIAGD